MTNVCLWVAAAIGGNKAPPMIYNLNGCRPLLTRIKLLQVLFSI